MAKKEWREVPECELSEEEVRRGFNRLRELFKESQFRVHEMKVERWKLRVEVDQLRRQNRLLTNEVRRLKEWEGVRVGRKGATPKVEITDFKKRFFDSL